MVQIRSEAVKGGNFTILVADGKRENLNIISGIFAQDNYNVLLADSGAQALHLVAEHKVDVMLLDVMMPDMSGCTVCEKIREKHTLYDLPVVLVTDRSISEDVLAGFSAGANYYVIKPVNADEIRACIAMLLAIKKEVQNAIGMEVAFLKSLITPHFLNNVINTIIAFCYTDNVKAAEILREFSKYMFWSFSQDNDLCISLGTELELVNSYVALEQARFSDRLTVSYEIDQKVLHYQLPPLTILPLVANAIRHGLMKKEEGGKVILIAGREEEHLVIKVIDNGVGIHPDKLAELFLPNPSAKGVGLRQVNRRLLKFYGKSLTIFSKEGYGTEVIVKIPVCIG